MLAAPGLFILGWTSFSLLAWRHNKDGPLPFERKCTDEVRLVRTSVDLTYGLLPVMAGVFAEAYSLTGATNIPSAVFWLVLAGICAYPILYYGILRPLLVSMYVMIRNRARTRNPGA
jgi:hypothetical protein